MSKTSIDVSRPARPLTQARARARRSRWVEVAGRVGHVAKGVSYGLIAVLALQVAFGDRARPGDKHGVLREVASSSFGTGALIALAIGFVAYAVWQFVRAVLDRGGEGHDAEGMAKRSKHAVVGTIYLVSAVAAVSLAAGSHSGGGDEQAETARVLSWPFGQWIVGAVGLALLGYGIGNAVKAMTQSFRDDLREYEMPNEARPWVVGLGVVGHVARGVVFVTVGFFLTKAAVEYDPDEAVGIDGALAKLADRSYGTWILAAVALSLLAYGVFCLVQARYRDV
jgi:Domain of Unknown Function (DUF1206)